MSSATNVALLPINSPSMSVPLYKSMLLTRTEGSMFTVQFLSMTHTYFCSLCVAMSKNWRTPSVLSPTTYSPGLIFPRSARCMLTGWVHSKNGLPFKMDAAYAWGALSPQSSPAFISA